MPHRSNFVWNSKRQLWNKAGYSSIGTEIFWGWSFSSTLIFCWLILELLVRKFEGCSKADWEFQSSLLYSYSFDLPFCPYSDCYFIFHFLLSIILVKSLILILQLLVANNVDYWFSAGIIFGRKWNALY